MIFAIKQPHFENCTSWPWPTFWRSNIWNVNISKTVRAAAKIHETTCRFWYLPSNGLIAKIILHDLDILFQGNKLETLISLVWLVLAQKCMGRLLYIFIFAIEEHYKNYTPWPRPTFWRSKCWNVNILKTARASAKMDRSTFIDIDICQQRTPWRKL